MSLQAEALIELYAIDAGSSHIGIGFSPMYFVSPELTGGVPVSYVNSVGTLVTYLPVPISIGGFEVSGANKLPMPKATFSNFESAFTDLNFTYGDLIGFRLTRIRTFSNYLESVDGVPTGTFDANAHYTPEQYYFHRKMEENNQAVVYEMSSVFDVEGIRFPKRRIYTNYCPFIYKGPECGYTGSLPQCPKSLTACKQRFNGDLPFGGFPSTRA